MDKIWNEDARNEVSDAAHIITKMKQQSASQVCQRTDCC